MRGPSRAKEEGKARGRTQTEDAELKLSRSAGQFATIESVRAGKETSSLVFTSA